MDKVTSNIERDFGSGKEQDPMKLFVANIRSGRIDRRTVRGAAMTGHEMSKVFTESDSNSFESIRTIPQLKKWLPKLLNEISVGSSARLVTTTSRELFQSMEGPATDEIKRVVKSFEAYIQDPESEEAGIIQELQPLRDIETAGAKALGITQSPENQFIGDLLNSLTKLRSFMDQMRNDEEAAQIIRPYYVREAITFVSKISENLGVERSKESISSHMAQEVSG